MTRSDAPPLTDVGDKEGQTNSRSGMSLSSSRISSFIIVFRKAWNWLADFIGFVKKSAMLSLMSNSCPGDARSQHTPITLCNFCGVNACEL